MLQLFRSLFRSQPQPVSNADAPETTVAKMKQQVIDFTLPVNEDEKELVSVIASSIAAGDHPNSSFRVTHIEKIDTDKEIAAAIVAAVMVHDKKDATVRLVSIQEIQKDQ